MEKVQWNSIDKKQYGLEQSKNDESSTLPSLKYAYVNQFQISNLILILSKFFDIEPFWKNMW